MKFLLNLGENLCESNIGNLSIKLKKYDKAIFHLSQSIKFTRSTDLISNKSLIHIKNNHKITRFSSRTCKIYINILAIFKKNILDNIDFIKTSPKKLNRADVKPLLYSMKNNEKIELLESRYPKLIFAYKKFFKTFKKMIFTTETFNQIANGDIFATKEKHSLAEFERILREVKFRIK